MLYEVTVAFKTIPTITYKGIEEISEGVRNTIRLKNNAGEIYLIHSDCVFGMSIIPEQSKE